MTNKKVPSAYEIDTIAEHAMRRLFQASGKSWEEYGPDDAQRKEWIVQALTTPEQGLDALNAERTEWKVPKRTNMRPVAEVAALPNKEPRLSDILAAAEG